MKRPVNTLLGVLLWLKPPFNKDILLPVRSRVLTPGSLEWRPTPARKQVPSESRQIIVELRDARQQELASAKARDDAVRLVERAKTGPREKSASGSGCVCCSVS